ncbi:MAG: hypothetical protein IKA99_02660 [Clostridia bacterium]|nr:hypothetical protein [Clostridia bacterium]
MKSTDVEFVVDTTHTAEAENNSKETASCNPYGKFKDAESLLKAYESLESEFTRRSQRLKTIEGELKSRSQMEKTVEKAVGQNGEEEDFFGRYPHSSQYAKEIEKELENGSLKKEEAYIKILERNLSEAKNKPDEKSDVLASFNKEFSTIVIQEYLKKIMREKPKTKAISGVMLTTPPLKPTTVAEASALAKKYIKRKGE